MVLNIKERLPLVISCSYNIIKTPGTVSCYVNNYVLRKLLPLNFKFCVPSATLPVGNKHARPNKVRIYA